MEEIPCTLLNQLCVTNETICSTLPALICKRCKCMHFPQWKNWKIEIERHSNYGDFFVQITNATVRCPKCQETIHYDINTAQEFLRCWYPTQVKLAKKEWKQKNKSS